MQNESLDHVPNHYHALMQELQEAKQLNHITRIQFLDRDLLVFMVMDTQDSKLTEVAEHISKKYRVFTKANMVSKTITIFDVYSLDPRV